LNSAAGTPVRWNEGFGVTDEHAKERNTMSHFLIYAARLQDAGICDLWVSLGSDKTRTRLMHVSPGAGTPPELAARYPTRTFELCGTEREIERAIIRPLEFGVRRHPRRRHN
jgi:hypothetical protein